MAVHMTYINRTTSAYQKELLASPNQAGLTRTIRTETVPLKVLAAMGGDAAGKGGSRRFAFKAETDWRSMGGGAGGCMAPAVDAWLQAESQGVRKTWACAYRSS